MSDSTTIAIALPDGFTFTGTRMSDQAGGPHYRGNICFPDGRVFTGIATETGEPVNGCMKYPDGNEYTGTFRNGEKLFGTMFYRSPGDVLWRNQSFWTTTYIGGWKNNVWHGTGKLFTCTGTGIYEGNWENGKPSGKFEITLAQETDMYAKQFMDLGERRCRKDLHYTVTGIISNGHFQGDAVVLTKESEDEWNQAWITIKREYVCFDESGKLIT